MVAEHGYKRDYKGREGLLRELSSSYLEQGRIFQNQIAEEKTAASFKVNSVAFQA
jgi:hypothetical protein